MLIRDATVILSDKLLTHTSVRTDEALITDIGAVLPSLPGEPFVDANGLYLAPGFIDLHMHLGYLGPRFTFEDELELSARNLPRNGTTRYLPTLISAVQGLLPAQFRAVRDFMHRSLAG